MTPLLILMALVAIALIAFYGHRRGGVSLALPQPEASTPSDGQSLTEEPDPTPVKPNLQAKYCANPYATTCRTPWPSPDPTGTVKPDVNSEVRALRLLRNLIRENPSWTSEQVQEELARTVYTQTGRERAEDAFQWALKAIEKFIVDQPSSILNDQEKQNLKARILQINLELPPPASVYADAIDLMTKNTVYYERTPKGDLRLRMGGAYLLNTTSWFNILYTLSHEIAHAIDPCEARHANITPRAYTGLISCFVSRGWVEPQRAECGPEEQISEVFADWMASQIVGQALLERQTLYSASERVQAAINTVRDLCEQTSGDTLVIQHHQEPRLRIGRIVGNNPRLRKALACGGQSTKRHCELSPVAAAQAKEKSP